jgi:hypothetical protein
MNAPSAAFAQIPAVGVGVGVAAAVSELPPPPQAASKAAEDSKQIAKALFLISHIPFKNR